MAARVQSRRLLMAGTALAAWLGAGHAFAAGEVTVYCGVNEEWCRPMVAAFQRKTGITVNMTRKSAGETFAQVKAEAANPKGDIWWGGTGDPHLQAAEEGLTLEYKSPKLDELYDWAKAQAEDAHYRTVGIYAGVLGFSYNDEGMKSLGGPAPACWKDLIDPRFKDEVQVADPNSSGTAYNMLATIVQLMGEDGAFTWLAGLHRNVNQYTKSGAAPARAVATGETTIGITFLHDALTQKLAGAPVTLVPPCEGTGFEIGSMSIIKGAPNLENAKAWYEWALTPEAQAVATLGKAYQIPSNKGSAIPPEAPRLENVKLIDYDFAKYGSSETRSHLLKRWSDEISTLPK